MAYKTPHIVSFNNVTQSSGNYIPVGHTSMDSTSSTEANQQTYMFKAGTWTGLSVYIRIANASGDTTLTVRKNGVDTALTVTFPSSTNGLVQDLSNSVSVSVGDLISIGITTTGGTVIVNSITTLFEADDGVTTQYLRASSSGGAATLGAVTRYPRIAGDLDSSSTFNTEARGQQLMQHAGTVVGMGIMVSAYAGTGGSLVLRKNGADGNHSITISGTGLATTTNTDSFSANDLLNYAFTGSSGNLSAEGMQLCTISTDNQKITLLGGKALARNNSTSNLWSYMSGTFVFSGAAENVVRAHPVTGGVLSGMAWYAYTNTATQNLTIQSRLSGADGNMTITYSGTGWQQDTTNSDTHTSSTYMAIRTARTATGSGTTSFSNQSALYTMDLIASATLRIIMS